MKPAELREHCLSFTGAEETFPFGPNTSVFKVAGKMFAPSQLAANPLAVSLKCEPGLAEALREAHPAVLPGYHLNNRHWNSSDHQRIPTPADAQGRDRGLIRPGREQAATRPASFSRLGRRQLTIPRS
jgi:predicted DNA-binding protein (MmcQ/YjbR family)